MDKLIKKLGGYGSTKYRELMDALESVGAELTTWYEAVRYKGSPKKLTLELCIKGGLFSKERVAMGDDIESLQSLSSYLKHHPLFKDRKFTFMRCRKVVQNGDFTIVQRIGFKGGDKQAVADVVIRFGGDQEDIDIILDHVDEKPLGYLVSVSPQEAHAFAQIVHIGATTPVSREEMIGLFSSLKSAAQNRVNQGDKDAKTLISIWQRLGDYWRTMSDEQFHIKLAHQYYKEGLIGKAIGEYQKAIQKRPNIPDYHYDLGILLAEKGDVDNAVAEYKEAIRIDPNHYFAHNNLGQMYESKGMLEDAKEQLRNAIRIDPGNPNAHGNLGIVCYHQGLLNEAVAEYEECLKLDPKIGSVRNLLQVVKDEQIKTDELEKRKNEAWHVLSGSSVVRFWGISLHRMEQLIKEWKQLEIVYESLRKSTSQKEIDVLFAIIASCEDLTLDQKAIADFALLAVVEGSIPTTQGIECLKIVFRSRPDLLEAILKRCVHSSD